MQISLASKNIIAATGVVTLPVNADLAYWIECVGAVETVSKAFGTIDILVDNDGIGVIGYVEEANLTDRALCRLPEPGGGDRDARSAARDSRSEHRHGGGRPQRRGVVSAPFWRDPECARAFALVHAGRGGGAGAAGAGVSRGAGG